MNVAFFSTQLYDSHSFNSLKEEYQQSIDFFDAPLNAKTINLVDGHQAVCVFVNDQLDAFTLNGIAEKEVQIIALRCAGFNNVDLQSSKALGLKVVRVPAYSPYAVAEHALALILTLNRKTHKAYNRVREGNFSLVGLTGFDLNQKTIGVVGTGKIGSAFCRIMLGMGCHVLAFDPFPSEKLEQAGVQYTSLEKLFSLSEIVSLHCPLTKETHHIVNEASLSIMKTGAMLINTSRGGLVDTAAVIRALKSQKLGYFGLDVYEQEEHLFFQDLSETIIQDDQIARLMTFPNVLITAHQSFFTKEALEQIARVTLQNLQDFEQGRQLTNEVRLG